MSEKDKLDIKNDIYDILPKFIWCKLNIYYVDNDCLECAQRSSMEHNVKIVYNENTHSYVMNYNFNTRNTFNIQKSTIDNEKYGIYISLSMSQVVGDFECCVKIFESTHLAPKDINITNDKILTKGHMFFENGELGDDSTSTSTSTSTNINSSPDNRKIDLYNIIYHVINNKGTNILSNINITFTEEQIRKFLKNYESYTKFKFGTNIAKNLICYIYDASD